MLTSDQESTSNFHIQNVPSPIDIANSVNTINSFRDYIVSEDLIAGQRNNGRMSNVRRFFCLFVTFDFLFTSLMWIICVMLNGEYIIKALTEQVLHYNIHTSLFDIVLVAFCRFFVLVLFYAVISINHWIVISISTAATCGFLITKVLYFDWPHSSQPVFEVLLVLTSFVLAWGEAWFLDFRVLPQETYANGFVVASASDVNERTSLIRGFIPSVPSLYTESYANFYSPQETPEGSVYRLGQEEEVKNIEYVPVTLTEQQEKEYRNLAMETLKEAWQLYRMDDWAQQKQIDNDCVYARLDTDRKKMFKLRAEIDVTPRYMLEELYNREMDVPKWNSSVKECHNIQTIDENTDISYTISKDSAGGLISSRDFVNLRHWCERDGTYIICLNKTEHPSVPINKKLARGENRVGAFVIEPIEDPNKCILHWMVNTDLKLNWVPSSVLEREMVAMMLRFVKDLRDHLSATKQV